MEEEIENKQSFKQTKIMDAINCSPNKNFTQISNIVFRMPGLSFKAKGILCSLLSNKDGWVSYRKSLENLGAEGTTAIQSGLDELLEHGFFWSVRYQDKKTKVNKGCFWAYTDEPFKFEIKKQLLILEEKGLEIWKGSIRKLEESFKVWSEKQEVEKQEVEKQEVGFPLLANQGLIIPIIPNTKIQKKKYFGDAAKQQSPTHIENNFDLEVSKQSSNKTNSSPADKIFQKKAQKILSKLNILGSKNYKPNSPSIKYIVARLKDGYSYRECIKVLETKIQDPWFLENPKFYRPSTLFCPKNFEDYLNEDPTQYKKQPKQNIPSNGSGLSGRKYPEPLRISIKQLLTTDEDL